MGETSSSPAPLRRNFWRLVILFPSVTTAWRCFLPSGRGTSFLLAEVSEISSTSPVRLSRDFEFPLRSEFPFLLINILYIFLYLYSLLIYLIIITFVNMLYSEHCFLIGSAINIQLQRSGAECSGDTPIAVSGSSHSASRSRSSPITRLHLYRLVSHTPKFSTGRTNNSCHPQQRYATTSASNN